MQKLMLQKEDELDLPAAAQVDAPAGDVVAEVELDLDDDLRYGRRRVVLTESQLHIDERVVPLSDIDKAEHQEAIGFDRLVLTLTSGRRVELPFSRRERVKLSMTRLIARLKHRVDGDGEPDLSPPPLVEGPDLEKDLDRPRVAVLGRLLEVAKPYHTRIIFASVLTMLVGVVQVVPAWLTKYVIDASINPQTTAHLTRDERVSNLVFWGGLYVLAIVVQMTMFGVRLRLLSAVGTWVARDLRTAVYSHMHKLSLRYFGKHRTGSLITRVTSDTDRLWDFIVFGSVDYARNVLMMAAATVIMFWVNPRLAVIALLPVPFVALLTWYKMKKMTQLFGRLWTYWSRLTGVVGDVLPGAKVVKAFAAEGREVGKFSKQNKIFSDDELSTINVWVNLQPIVEGTMMLSRVLILVAGGWFIIESDIARTATDADTLGTLVMFLTVAGFYHMAIGDMVQKQRLVTRAATSAQRVFEVLDTPIEIKSKPDAYVPTDFEGRVELQNVSFSYDGAKPVLRNVSLAVEPGQMVGLCGHSGAGKSTFVNLISRFYDVSDGSILIDGVDVRDYDLEWLRGNVGVVLQEPYLFYGTVADNIRYGRPDATLGEVVEAARAANTHDFITKLPDGYDTIVGERGQSLSGGERQRVSIARAILQNPKILILDEATSSVDTKTERAIQEALDHLVTGRTTFAIAHRLSTLASADMIVVLDAGRVVESGRHDELLANEDGRFRKLVQMQNRLQANALTEEEPE